jgi:microfibrillar-associated protein 1
VVNQIKRPVFIRKEDRYMQEKEIEEELKAELEKKRIKQSIKEQNKQIVIEAKAVREDLIDETDIFGSDTELPNDDDDNPELAYSLWRERELGRLRRDREEREKEF